jgi:hypothetical protein
MLPNLALSAHSSADYFASEYGVAVPRSTPPEIVDRLNDGMVLGGSSAAFEKLITEATEKRRKLIKLARSSGIELNPLPLT